jgi:hypothetical protein
MHNCAWRKETGAYPFLLYSIGYYRFDQLLVMLFILLEDVRCVRSAGANITQCSAVDREGKTAASGVSHWLGRMGRWLPNKNHSFIGIHSTLAQYGRPILYDGTVFVESPLALSSFTFVVVPHLRRRTERGCCSSLCENVCLVLLTEILCRFVFHLFPPLSFPVFHRFTFIASSSRTRRIDSFSHRPTVAYSVSLLRLSS